jgi:hypothetical protein
MKKYSIIINHIGNDRYAVIIKSFALEDGQEVDVHSLVQKDKSILEALEIANKYVEQWQ